VPVLPVDRFDQLGGEEFQLGVEADDGTAFLQGDLLDEAVDESLHG
jgi:hypothetical protein